MPSTINGQRLVIKSSAFRRSNVIQYINGRTVIGGFDSLGKRCIRFFLRAIARHVVAVRPHVNGFGSTPPPLRFPRSLGHQRRMPQKWRIQRLPVHTVRRRAICVSYDHPPRPMKQRLHTNRINVSAILQIYRINGYVFRSRSSAERHPLIAKVQVTASPMYAALDERHSP